MSPDQRDLVRRRVLDRAAADEALSAASFHTNSRSIFRERVLDAVGDLSRRHKLPIPGLAFWRAARQLPDFVRTFRTYPNALRALRLIARETPILTLNGDNADCNGRDAFRSISINRDFWVEEEIDEEKEKEKGRKEPLDELRDLEAEIAEAEVRLRGLREEITEAESLLATATRELEHKQLQLGEIMLRIAETKLQTE